MVASRAHRTTPDALLASLLGNRALVLSLARREIAGRYRGSALGLLWSVVNPLLMLAVYTFVFSFVFQQKVPGGTGSRAEFALLLFAGLIVYNLFAECIGRAPSLILANTNYVKKVVFPLEVLPVVTLGSALFHFAISLGVWLVFYAVAIGAPHATTLLLPVVMLPLLASTIGIAWLLAALGVYLRDVAQFVGVLLMVLMFMSPIFYPIEAIPAAYRAVLYASPLTLPIEQVRDVLMWGRLPAVGAWAAYSTVATAVACAGFAFFQKTRRGFADVL